MIRVMVSFLVFAVDEFYAENAFDPRELYHDVLRNVFANSNGHDVGAAFGGVTNLHAVDVDLCFPEDGGDLANHVWTVHVWNEQEVAVWCKVYAILVDLGDLRLLAVKEGPFEVVFTVRGFDANGDSSAVVTGLMGLGFLDIEVTLLCKARCVHIVDAVLEDWV